MALTTRYANFDLVTGANDGTSEANAWQTWADFEAGAAAGHHVYLRQTASRVDLGVDEIFATGGTDASGPLVLEGYKTTPGDGGDAGVSNYFQGGSISQARRLLFTGAYIRVRFWDWRSASSFGDPAIRSNGLHCLFDRCCFRNYNTSNAGSFLGGAGTTIVNCKIEGANSSASAAVTSVPADGAIVKSYIYNNNSGTWSGYCVNAINTFSSCWALAENVIRGSGTGMGIRIYGDQGDDQRFVYKNTIHNFDIGIKIEQINVSGLGRNHIGGNLIYSCEEGMDSDEATTNCCYGVEMISNAIGDAATARYTNLGEGPTLIDGDVTLTADPFTSSATADYSLNDTAGGGAACKSAMMPVDSAGDGTNLDKSDIGAVQDGS